jgi:hypothetical protein
VVTVAAGLWSATGLGEAVRQLRGLLESDGGGVGDALMGPCMPPELVTGTETGQGGGTGSPPTPAVGHSLPPPGLLTFLPGLPAPPEPERDAVVCALVGATPGSPGLPPPVPPEPGTEPGPLAPEPTGAPDVTP